MKKTSLLWLFALLLVLPLGFASCSDDDDDIPGSAEELVGTWELTYEKWIEKEDGKVTESGEEFYDSEARIRLDADGTYATAYFYNNEWHWSNVGTWSYSDGRITLKEIRYQDVYSGKVTDFSGNKLAVEFEETSNDDGVSFYGYSYQEFVRVNE